MASTIKVKRSAIQGKAPTTSNLEVGEIALNTRDGRLYSKGTQVFEVGANTHSLFVGTGGATFANGAYTLPDSDGAALQILQTDGSGTISWIALEQAEGGGFTRGTLTTFPTGDYHEGGTGTETFVGELGSGGTDVFGVSLGAVYDSMDPNGRIVTEDLGALT